MAIFRALALTLALTAPAAAGDLPEWTWGDTAWESAFQTALAVDCAQTWRGVGTDPAHFEETNQLLGQHPNKARIAATCLGVGVGHYFVSRWLSPEARNLWQIGTITVELIAIERNHMAGLRVGFRF
jgi:hypothetical protein